MPNLPSQEVYDLLKDSKGYLWAAHESGITRYDGTQFQTFYHPNQTALAMTDLAEDKQGRIWCHNFNAQLFYVEKLKLHLLKEYKADEEHGFPRLVVCGNEVVATSAKGLFVYNTLTAKATYHIIPQGTTSLVRIGQTVVCYGASGWHCYQAGKPIRKLKANFTIESGLIPVLQPASYKDSFYLIANPIGNYYTLTQEGDNVKMHAKRKTSVFINTLSVHQDGVWVHTKDKSYKTDGKESIQGMNLSDLLTDDAGHWWMSSLNKGVCVQYNAPPIYTFPKSTLMKGEYIRRMYAQKSDLFLGTTLGNLYIRLFHSLIPALSLPPNSGALEQIAALDNHRHLLAASVGTYLYNIHTQALTTLSSTLIVKDVALHKDTVFLATTTGVKYFDLNQLKEGRPPLLYDLSAQKSRCRGIAISEDGVLAIFNDGVYAWHNHNFRPLLYNGASIYASAIKTLQGKVVIATYNQGLLILESGRWRNLTEREGLASNLVREVKIISGDVWLLYDGRFQQLNKSLTAVEENAFPFSRLPRVTNFDIVEDTLYAAADDELYAMGLNRAVSEPALQTYIDALIANGKDSITGNKMTHLQNHLEFRVSTPYFSSHSKLIYRYRIASAVDSVWQWGALGQSVFTIISLAPGIYSFEIQAFTESKKAVGNPARYSFEIIPPWHQTLLFKISAGFIATVIVFSFVALYYANRLRKQRREYEKLLAIQHERQRISSEIHDDVGAGLSALRLLTEMTKEKLPQTEGKLEMNKIHTAITELSGKVREVVWSLNTENDRLESLLYYIQRQAALLFENSSIQLKTVFPSHEIPFIVIKGEKRRHIALSVKEALHNCLKHSEAEICQMTMFLGKDSLHIQIADDGRGFADQTNRNSGHGLTSMKRRMQQVGGSLDIKLNDGTEIHFIIPINEELI